MGGGERDRFGVGDGFLCVYQKDGFATAKDEINSAFNIAVFIEMFSLVITKSILKSINFDIIERCLVSTYSQCCCLSSNPFTIRPRRRILIYSIQPRKSKINLEKCTYINNHKYKINTTIFKLTALK